MTTKPTDGVGDFLQGLFGSVETPPAQAGSGSVVPTPAKPSEAKSDVAAVDPALAELTSSPLQRERRERPALAVGDVVLESAVGAGKITSFTSRGAPRVNEIPAAWLKRDDGFVYDPMGRRRS